MKYLLDTNIVIAGLNGDASVLARLVELNPEDAILCAPVAAELRYGALCSARKDQNLERVQRLVTSMRFEPFGLAASKIFGEIKAPFRTQGISKSDFDLAIASIALALDATLVTDDQALHDGSIAELVVENWLVRKD